MKQTKTKNTFKHIFFGLLILSLFANFSCGNAFNPSTKKDEPKDEKTYLSIPRTVVYEGTSQVDKIAQLTDCTLTGTKLDAAEDAADSATKTFFENKTGGELPKVEIEAGKWSLTFSAKLDQILYSATKEVTIVGGKTNDISFAIKPVEHFGGYEITFDVTDSVVTSVKATLTKADADETETPITKTVTIDEAATAKTAVFKRAVTNTEERLASGTYLFYVEFFAGNDATPINTWENYIAIQDGVMTKATVALNFNALYTITYEKPSTAQLAGGSEITKYSVRSSFDLPNLKKSGQIFTGWYEKIDGVEATTPTTKIEPGTTGNKTFVAKFDDPVLYVRANGNDATATGAHNSAFKTINGACEKIAEVGDSTFAWTIYVTGEISGVSLETSGDGAKYGPTIIPAAVNNHAQSIHITGTNTAGADGVPKDIINRGKRRSSGVDGNGTVLTINTSVPVTITNLKITGGEEYGDFGGGLRIAKGATVSLGNGVLIIENRNASNGRGGGIHNEGTLYMYGSAVVGDKSNGGKTDTASYTYAKDSSSSDVVFKDHEAANNASAGGGLYNGNSTDETIKAKAYIGYRPVATGPGYEKAELTGGFYYNSGTGGAIYNAKSGSVYIASGNFEWNGNNDGGGGAIHNDGYVYMSGGSIINNRAIGTNAGYGGGVFNAHYYSKFEMCGGTINKNLAYRFSAYGDLSYGGGVYNNGQFFMYGSAVIGDKDATTTATTTSYGNKAMYGGAIYNNVNTASNQNGGIFLGYKPDANYNPVAVSDTDETEKFTGGIFYNYACYSTQTSGNSEQKGGGAIESTGTLKIASGTIAYNRTDGYGGAIRTTKEVEICGGTIKDNTAAYLGGAIYIDSDDGSMLKLSGNISIPAGSDNKHDIYVNGSKTFYPKITIADALASTFAVRLTPKTYDPSMQILKLATGVDTTSIDAERAKFTVADEYNSALDTTTHWSINSSGYLTSTEPLGKAITINIEQGNFSDVSMSARYYSSVSDYTFGQTTGGTNWRGSIDKLTKGKILVLDVADAPSDHTYTYKWFLDGVLQDLSSQTSEDIFVFDTASTSIVPGVYDIVLQLTDTVTGSSTEYYSYEAHVIVNQAQQ